MSIRGHMPVTSRLSITEKTNKRGFRGKAERECEEPERRGASANILRCSNLKCF